MEIEEDIVETLQWKKGDVKLEGTWPRELMSQARKKTNAASERPALCPQAALLRRVGGVLFLAVRSASRRSVIPLLQELLKPILKVFLGSQDGNLNDSERDKCALFSLPGYGSIA